MKKIYHPGDSKKYTKRITKGDVAAFNGKVVHNVCSTFALAREIEMSTRLFVLDMAEADEEGIGTKLEINHRAPAFINDVLEITATIDHLIGNELICSYSVHVGERLIADGITGQKILKRKRIDQIFSTFE